MQEGSLQRIKRYLDAKNITVSAFEKESGFSNGAFGSQLKNHKTIGVDKLENILKVYPDINPGWILTGNGTMLKQNKPERAGTPLITIQAAAGFSNDDFRIHEEDIIDRYAIPDFTNIDFMMPLKGQSMTPKFKSGDIVACRILRESKFIQWNKPYIVATKEQGILCKRLKKSGLENHYLAISDNQDYDPFDLPIDEITGIALIVGVVRLE